MAKRINSISLTSKTVATLEISQAIQSSQVSKIVREHGETIMVALIVKLINETIKLIPSTLTPSEMKAVAELLTRKYWMLKINEFVIMFRDGMTQSYGKEGKVFGQLSAKDIFNWADLYNERRAREIQHMQDSRKFESERETIRDWNPKVLEAMRKAIPEKKPKKAIEGRSFAEIMADPITLAAIKGELPGIKLLNDGNSNRNKK